MKPSVFASILASLGAAMIPAGSVVTSGRRADTHARNQRRAEKRRKGRRPGYELIDGVWHKQSDKFTHFGGVLVPRGYPGAKFARKALFKQLTLRS